MKLSPCVSIQSGDEPGMLAVRFDYKYESLREELKQLAGVAWNPTAKHWKVAAEYLPEVERLAQRHGLKTLNKVQHSSPVLTLSVWTGDSRLHEYQRKGVQQALNKKRYMLNFEMGLGKTPAAIEVLKQLKATNILIVCPAMVRLNWLKELKKWGFNANCRVISTGAQWDTRDPNNDVVITSYSLLEPALAVGNYWHAIVFDESHYIKERSSARSKTALALRRKNPDAAILLLTATPITSEPQDLWHQLEVLYPGRFGSYWQFVKRYCNTAENNWGGIDIWGVNEVYTDELRRRLDDISMRVTKHEVAHLLPPFTAFPTQVEIGSKRLREMTEEFEGALEHKKQLDNFVLQAGAEKVPFAVERTIDVFEGGQSHVMVLTWFRATADAIFEALKKKKLPVTHIDGGVNVTERARLLDDAASNPASIVVSTMASIREGIDLTKFTYVVGAELYWQHAMVEQVMGRYHRLSSQIPSTFEWLLIKGTLDEIIAKTLLRRGRDIGKVMRKGVAAEKMSEALGMREITDEEALVELQKVAHERDGFDEYT